MDNICRWFTGGILVAALLLSAGVTLTHSYGLQQRDREMIAIAYLNGAAEALRFDIERIKAMQADSHLLQQTVQDAAQLYLIRVERINAVRQQAEARVQRAAAGRGITSNRQW
jgi:hypothetical protein